MPAKKQNIYKMSLYQTRDYLTHYSLVAHYGDISLDQHWPRHWLAAWWHQAITRTNIDSSKVFCGFHIRMISHELILNLICNWYVFGDYTFKITAISTKVQWVSNQTTTNKIHDNDVIMKLNRLFRCRSKKTSKLHVTSLCVGNSSVTGEFPARRASNAENVSIWWRHYVECDFMHIP